MELHVVFFKSDYKSIDEATKHSDGLVVMAFFFEVGNKTINAYEEFTNLLDNIKKPNMKKSLKNPLALIDYVQTNFDEYYVYNGSLTTV
jgi:carbonic anhydrase